MDKRSWTSVEWFLCLRTVVLWCCYSKFVRFVGFEVAHLHGVLADVMCKICPQPFRCSSRIIHSVYTVTFVIVQSKFASKSNLWQCYSTDTQMVLHNESVTPRRCLDRKAAIDVITFLSGLLEWCTQLYCSVDSLQQSCPAGWASVALSSQAHMQRGRLS